MKVTFANGTAECGCKLTFSDGHGEYSDVHEIELCNEHSKSKEFEESYNKLFQCCLSAIEAYNIVKMLGFHYSLPGYKECVQELDNAITTGRKFYLPLKVTHE